MSKRITQSSTVVVPAHVAHANEVAGAKAAVVPADGAVKVEVAKGDVAPAAAVIAAAAPLAMVQTTEPAPATGQTMPSTDPMVPAPAQDTTTSTTTSDTASTDSSASTSDDGSTDYTPYIVGGALLAGGVLAVALSGGDDDKAAPAPAPTPTPTNTAPTITSAATASVAENSAVSTVVYKAAATDAQGNAITYAIGGTDAAAFNINTATGEVTLKSSANFEAKASYTFTVTATDNATPPLTSTAQTVTLTVTDVNEAPTFANATATVRIDENVPVTTTVFTAAATDPDASTSANGRITYSLTGADAGAFNINAQTGVVTFRASPDFETKSSYAFNVVATDGGTTPLTASQAVTVNINDVMENTAPTFGEATRTTAIDENVAAGTVVVTGGATDSQGAVTYSLTGADAGAFAVNAQTGAVTFVASPNFEAKSSYSFNLVATDAGGLTATQANTVTIRDVNEAPTFADATRATAIDENVPAGTVVVTGGATDPDAGNTLTYSLTGTDAGAFAVNAQTGAVTFVASPDFETKSSYSFNLVATDAGGLSATQANTVTIRDVNEAPTFAEATRVATLDENVAAGTVVPGSAMATDVDAGTTLTYSLTGADASAFAINAATGVVTIVASPDFETKPSYSFGVVATDQGGLSVTQTVTLNINDIVENPTVILVGTQNLDATGADFQYIESAGTANTSTITGFTAGDTITVDVPTSNYSFSNNGADLIISYGSNGVANQITLVGAVASDAFIYNEATAEQAIGSDFFRADASVPVEPPVPSQTVSIDGPGAQATYDAANAAVTFNENAGTPNATTITNFGADDRIVVSGTDGATAATQYSFQNNGADLIISFAGNGTANQITLQGAVSADVFVYNEATAEAAVGADFFRYA